MQRLLQAVILTMALFSCGVQAQSATGVVINEVFTGSPDWIEIRNMSGTPRDLSGWKLEATFAFTPYPSFTFPAGTSIAAGECILVVENSNPQPFTTIQPPPGTQIHLTHFGYGWIGNSAGAVALANQAGVLQDLIVFGTTGQLLPPCALNTPFPGIPDRTANDPASGNVLYRHSMGDRDEGSDWSQSNNGSETPGWSNPGQDAGPQPVCTVEFSPNSGVVHIAANTNAVSVSANISALILDDGRRVTDPSWDLLIGGTVTMSGTAVTAAGSDWSGLIWTPATATITASNSEKLTLQGIFAAEPSLSRVLGGPLGTEPRKQRSMSNRTLVLNQLSGTSSPALARLHTLAQRQKLHFMARFQPGGARLVSINVTEPTTGPLASRLSNAGGGSLEVGVIGTTQPEIYNVFVINPAYATGTGPVYGIEWGIWQWQQVYTPLGTLPFHVAPTSDGTWFFQSPLNVVPPGIWLDHVVIEVVNQVPVFSEPTRAFF